MSQTELEYQSFVINYLNGQQPASEGEAITKAVEGETEAETAEETTGDDKVYTLVDFTDPSSTVIKDMSKTCHNCKLSFDEIEGALKVEITGEDPYFNIPMKKKMYFDGDDYCIVKMEYKTECEGTGEFFFTTKEVPSMELCNIQYMVDPTGGEYTVLELDMQDESMNWSGQIRNFRVDPIVEATDDGSQVFYYKSIRFEAWEEPVTEAPETTEPAETEQETEQETEAGEETVAETAEETEADVETNAETAKETEPSKGGASTDEKAGVPFWVWIIIGVVAVGAIAAVVVIVTKKKKQ